MRRALVLMGLFCCFINVALGHEGPPFPILVDKKMPGSLLSIWTDPDVGDGTFYLYLEGEEGRPLPEAIDVQLSASFPSRGPLGPQTAERNRKLEKATSAITGRHVYEGHLPFPVRGEWKVTFSLQGESITLPVDVTPSGPTKWEFALYFLPFLCVGFIWLKVIVKKSKLKRTA